MNDGDNKGIRSSKKVILEGFSGDKGFKIELEKQMGLAKKMREDIVKEEE